MLPGSSKHGVAITDPFRGAKGHLTGTAGTTVRPVRLVLRSEDENRVCWNHNRRRLRETVARWAGRRNRAAVSGGERIHPVVVHVAVEDLEPLSGPGEAEVVRPPGRLAQGRDNDDVDGATVDPTVARDHAILVVHVKGIEPIAAQRVMPAPKRDKLADEPQMIRHRAIRREAVPPDQR